MGNLSGKPVTPLFLKNSMVEQSLPTSEVLGLYLAIGKFYLQSIVMGDQNIKEKRP